MNYKEFCNNRLLAASPRIALWILALAACLHAAAWAADRPKVTYTLQCLPSEAPPKWKITVLVTGLDPAQRDIRMELPDWGGWTQVDAYYLIGLSGDPPVQRETKKGSRFVFDLPEQWAGTLKVQYAIPLSELGSKAHEQHKSLPLRSDTYAFGLTRNTLMRLLRNGAAVEAERMIQLLAPPGWKVLTGMGGVSAGKQTVTMPPGETNSVIAFGEPVAVVSSRKSGALLEVVQLGANEDFTKPILHSADTLLEAFGRTTGKPLDKTLRLFINDTGWGGVGTDYGTVLHFPPSTPMHEVLSPYTAVHVGHELFHNWLGGYLTAEDKSLVWLYEGFTDYIALWHAAATGLVDKDWFAGRLLELNEAARSHPAMGSGAFLNPEIEWRSGEMEGFAYKGGAMIAFFIDAALREKGHPGLMEMLRDILEKHGGSYSQDTIKAWMQSHDLGPFHARYLQGREWPSVDEALVSIGYGRVEKEHVLTYFGIRAETDASAPMGRITGLDPEGPAAMEGFEVGDIITGYFPSRSDQPEPGERVKTPYRFGLNRFKPGVEGTFIGVRRGSEDLKIFITPRPIPGDPEIHYEADASKVGAFFRI